MSFGRYKGSKSVAFREGWCGSRKHQGQMHGGLRTVWKDRLGKSEWLFEMGIVQDPWEKVLSRVGARKMAMGMLSCGSGKRGASKAGCGDSERMWHWGSWG